MGKPIVVVDFDGVIHSYTSGWKGADNIPDLPVEGALEWLWDAAEHFEINIISSRSSQGGGREAMKEWLIRQYRLFYGMDDYEATMFVRDTIKWPLAKPPALMTIDDRAYQFQGHFPPIDWIKKFKPWNKR